MKEKVVVALAGNPNVGKTTLFNNLTGARQHVGNWPGVTVEKKEGTCEYEDCQFAIVDLPGAYSLTAYSPDEVIARDYIAEEKPDVVVNIVDASNLERNLYLTVQLLEMGANVIIALNMMDEAESRGYTIDIDGLSRLLGAPVIPMVANKNQGTTELMEEILKASKNPPGTKQLEIPYGQEVETEITLLEKILADIPGLANRYSTRWLAIKLLEEDMGIIEKIGVNTEQIKSARDKSLAHLRSMLGDDAETVIAEARYGFISGLIRDVLKKPALTRLTLSDQIDKVVLNRWLGIPIFLVIMYGVFWLTFNLTPPLMHWIETGMNWLAKQAASIGGWFGSFLSEGVIGGVGSVLVFIPPIFMLFMLLAILEDVGYLARAAFVMDRLMHRIKLHGRSFVPMILGFGCSVPAIMATRTIENEKDRLTTILVTPFMSCGARLPIYVLLAAAFFPHNQGLVVFGLYVIGIVVGIIMAFVLRRTILAGESSHFVMELPPYRRPLVKSVLLHTWERGKVFLMRAGTVIFGVAILIWLLKHVGALEPIGKAIAPIFKPCGFGHWQIATSLIFGFFAKEAIIGTLGVLFASAKEAAGLGSVIASQLGMSSLAAFSLMVFALLYIPCVATIGTIKQETNSWKWAAFAAAYTTALAWIVATLIYQIGTLF